MELKEINSSKKYRILISGGGTGGHFYPAVAIAEKLVERYGSEIEILFVGANGKMEMDKVPLMGWNIIGLNIAGFQRRLTIKNLSLPFKVIGSYLKSRDIIKRFKPQVAIGFGGYVSLPIIYSASLMNVPTMIWEGNSFPGMANRKLAKKSCRIFVPHSKMSKYFDSKKMIVSGSPLRGGFAISSDKREEGYKYFSIDKNKPTILFTGGSLGTIVINDAILNYLDKLAADNSVNIIWQCGSFYNDRVKAAIEGRLSPNIWVDAFVNRMDLAYNVADLVVARSGASTLAELALMGKAVIFVPSSNVTDNHQMKNAMTYVNGNAAEIITDDEAKTMLVPRALELIANTERCEELRVNIKNFAQPKSADIIVDEIVKYIK